MKIGFEAKRAFTNGTGLGHYSRTLVSSLAEYFAENDYYLFTPKQTDRFNTDQFSNIHTVVPSSFPATFFTAAWRSNWVKKDLKKNGIDVYHGLSHEIPVGMRSTNIPSVVTMHDLIFERYPEQYNRIDVQIYRRKFKYACENADRVIAISEQTKADIIEFYKTPASKIDVCYQSCNEIFRQTISEEEKQRVQKMYSLPDAFLLYVGSVIERKNLLSICKGLHALKGKLDVPLIVIGDGTSYKSVVKKYIAENGMEKQVRFLSDEPAAKNADDFRSAKDFPAIYQQAIAMIYPSIFEGFGIPILEALCSRIPVITTNVSCMPETGGDAAYYVSPFDIEEMSQAIWSVTTNHELRSGMIEKGIQHADRFTRKSCAESVINVYRNLVQ
jgi:glycosyltransferase involved in cell wall biosynthesis